MTKTVRFEDVGLELPDKWHGTKLLEAGKIAFDRGAADHACRFFERNVYHVKGEWAGELFRPERWQRERIIRPIFGLVDPETGFRVIRRVFVEIPRKNGKSFLGSGIALKCLFADGEPGAECYSAAVDKKQASLVYDTAAASVQRSKRLRRRSKVLRGNDKRIVNTRTNGFYTVISADGKRAHGFSSHCIIGDELHAWPGDYHGSLLEALVTSTGSRRQAVIVFITTAGYDRKSVCYREYERACAARDGALASAALLPVIYEAPADCIQSLGWMDQDLWRAVNPNLGVSKKLEVMQDDAQRALESPPDLNAFLRLHLNIWTEQKTRWIPLDKWNACADPELELPEGEEVVAGIDLSTTLDTTSVAFAWELPDGRPAIKVHHWIPEETAVEREALEHIPYKQMERDGWVTLTPGSVIDYAAVIRWILEARERNPIRIVPYDPWNAELFRQELERHGLECVVFRQGFYSMGEPTHHFGRLWRSRKLVHDGNPLLAAQAYGCAIEEGPGGSLKPAKHKSSERIDGIVASIMAIWLATQGEGALEASEVLD